MQRAGFLETAYRGFLDAGIFEKFPVHVDRTKVGELVAAYEALLQKFSPQEIEALGRVPDEMMRKMGEVGLFGFSIAREYGGLGFNLWEYLEVIRELARRDLSVALVSIAHLSIGVKGIQLFGTEEQKAKYLPLAASGDMIFSYALTEPHIGSDAKHIQTTAVLSEDESHYILNGRKTYITNANYAGGLTVFAQLDPEKPGHMGAFVVETDWEGVQIGKDMPKMGLTASSTAAIHFKDVKVPRENLLGKPGDGFKIAMTILNFGRLGLGAASTGLMEQSVADMTKRARNRIQFGVPIENFELIQEKIVRARAHAFACDAMTTLTAAFLEEDPFRNVAMETSHVKLFGTTRAWEVLYDALQTAGGSGYIKTNPYEKRMRDFRVTTIFEGTTEIHSIYPPLFAIRRMTKEMGRAGSPLKSLQVFWKNLTGGLRWDFPFQDKQFKCAARQAKRNARFLKFALLAVPMLYRKNVMAKEYVLRRLTTLSLYTYAILAMLARMQKDLDRGLLSTEHRLLLDYMLQEMKERRRSCLRLWNTRKERLAARIFRWIRKD
ncbi:acyl-CoA dehydrogenase family member 9 [Desulfacinum infernum DSM 9756]|uniref:Acyl-CoA dehydrogenase family member 9 n=1 Tax=Desulfacinum infernum DSM 9756 TaxID=1121391 RepID=A0A1M5CUL2_9BACT|nr:acyl-CoA dehydrogenase family protein [Desulfacinum infernum]SHF58458.1 acyl-CoA dehydrogenase family member 9 [Desulfacinum infernum DSM 9756]